MLAEVQLDWYPIPDPISCVTFLLVLFGPKQGIQLQHAYFFSFISTEMGSFSGLIWVTVEVGIEFGVGDAVIVGIEVGIPCNM